MNTLYSAHTDQCLYNVHLYVRFKSCRSSKLLLFKCKYWILSNMTKPEEPCHGSGGIRQDLAAKTRVKYHGQSSAVRCGASDTGTVLPWVLPFPLSVSVPPGLHADTVQP